MNAKRPNMLFLINCLHQINVGMEIATNRLTNNDLRLNSRELRGRCTFRGIIVFKRAVLFVSVLTLLGALSIKGQVTTADLTGRVADPKGLAITGASISVVNLGTGAKRDAASGDAGEFSIPLLPVGKYKIAISKQGFATAVYDPIELVVGQKLNLDVNLKLGSSSEIMVVTDE